MTTTATQSDVDTGTTLRSAQDFLDGKPGVYPAIPADTYHGHYAISSSILKAIYTESPLYARAIMDGVVKIDSPALDIGAGVHSMTLTPAEFDKEFICAKQCDSTVKSSGDRCKNSGIKTFDGQWLCGVHGKGVPNECDGRTILSLDDYRRVKGVHAKLWDNPKSRSILQSATDFELSVLWTDEATGLLCKARFDMLCRKIGILPDLKTCRSIRTFQDDSWRAGYAMQLAHYRRGAIESGVGADVLAIIAVESDEPFDLWIPEIHPALLARGVEQRDATMQIVAECTVSGVWPGAGAGRAYLEVPAW